jgi:2-dehydro-3-deoxy-D-gluconate 5-dehydrogenase
MILEAFQLKGKNALVTGSSRGLGAAIAIALAEAGANVGCHGRSADGKATSETVRQMGRKSFYLAGDMTDADLYPALIGKTVEAFGSIDILVNNAGTIRRAPAAEYPLNYWNEIISINLTSVFRLSQLAAQDMLKRGAKGKILNIASLLSFQGGILVPAYAAAKGGVAQLTKALANEWASKGINVNAIAPATWRRTTLPHFGKILYVAGRSWSGFPPIAGESQMMLPALRFFSAHLPATMFTGT